MSTHENVAAESDLIEVIKGNPTPEQTAALHAFVADLSERAENRRRSKANTRGWFGAANDPFTAAVHNPAGFRSPNMPRDN